MKSDILHFFKALMRLFGQIAHNQSFLRITIVPLILAGQFFSSTFVFGRSGEDFFPLFRSESLLHFVKGPIEREVFGYSEHGREIVGYEVGEGENTILFIAGVHGNEKGTKLLLDRLVSELNVRPELIHPSNRVVIIPLVNPDGYFNREDKMNGRGVNLNRNFKTKGWVQFEGDQTFAGFVPFSESEARMVRDVVYRYQPVAMIAIHARGELVSPELTPVSIELSKWYANKVGYEYFDEWDFPGTATRWFEEEIGGPAITVELKNYRDSAWKKNKEALFSLISREW